MLKTYCIVLFLGIIIILWENKQINKIIYRKYIKTKVLK